MLASKWKVVPLISLTVVSLALTGCGVSVTGAGQELDRVRASQAAAAAESDEGEGTQLPSATPGVAKIQGTFQGSLTSAVAQSFNESGGSTSVSLEAQTTEESFAALCEGTIDMADSSRPISQSEWEVCRDNGLEVVQFQVASDAIVLATKAQTDLGGFCLSLDQVRDIFRSGSPYTNWSQIGFDEYPIDLAGPDADSTPFLFFGRYVLNSEAPTLVDVNHTYQPHETEAETRLFVTGEQDTQSELDELERRSLVVQQLREQLETAKEVYADALEEVAEAEAQREQGIEDDRSEAEQTADENRKQDSYDARDKALTERNAIQTKLDAAVEELELSTQAQADSNERLGNLGMFRLSYYEMFEDELQPLEITLEVDPLNCIFPSQRTVTNAVYPLSRQLLITTTTRGLNRAEVKDFLTHYYSMAQELATDQRFVPLPDVAVSEQRAWLTGAGDPEIVSFGESALRLAPQPAK